MKVDKNKILILHRYFIWANEMRTDFDGTLGQKKQQRIKQFMYMSLWYGMLYVVIEGWYDLGLNDSKVDELLKSKNVNLLKRYRNGVFHFQKRKYYDRRFMDLIQNGEEVVVWVQNLNKEIGRFFLEQLK
jgi:hypothetical protein